MIRPISFLLSFWLALLFVSGYGAHIPQLLVAAVGLGALFAGLGGIIAPLVGKRTRLVGPLALSLGLLAVCLIAVKMHVTPWFPFCIMLGAAALLATRVVSTVFSPRNRGTMAPADS